MEQDQLQQHQPATEAPAPTGDPNPELEAKVVGVVKTCFDPEIPVNIYDLGLIYGIDARTTGDVHIKMTLTSPMCPAAGTLPGDVQRKVSELPGVTSCKVDVVWDPVWHPSMMGEAAKLQLGLL